MPKAAFPYSTAAGAVLIPQDCPLGALAARILESSGIPGAISGLWRQMLTAIGTAEPQLPPADAIADLYPPLGTLVLIDVVAAFETFLRDLDRVLRQTAGALFPTWPSVKPAAYDGGRPYGFYFYRIRDVRPHFRTVFGVDAFSGVPVKRLEDLIRIRHLAAHRNGFPTRTDTRHFHFYRIAPQRRLLVSSSAVGELVNMINNAGTRINNRVGREVLRRWIVALPSPRWSKNRHRFQKILLALSFFGTLDRSAASQKQLYQAAFQQFRNRDAARTGLRSVTTAPPWN